MGTSLDVHRVCSTNLWENHMVTINTCPRCQMLISRERLAAKPAICDSCGFVVSTSETHSRQSMEKSVLMSAGLVSIVILALFMHVGSWGSYSLEIIPLKISQFVHTAAAADLERLSQIQFELRKYDQL